MPGPQVGEVVDGYEFLGGNPNDQKAWAHWGNGVRSLPDGSIVREGPKGGLQVLRQGNKAEAGGLPDIKEFQSKAAGQATLMDQALTDYTQARQDGYNPSSMRNTAASWLEDKPLLGGSFMADVVRDNPSERGRAAELAFTEGSLRSLTGAAATEGETRRNARNMFRQPGESAGVETNKGAVRDRFAATTKRIAGPAYIPPQQKQQPKGLPAAAQGAYTARHKAGKVDRNQPRGSQANPFLAVSEEVMNRLPRGSYVIAPDGSFGVIE